MAGGLYGGDLGALDNLNTTFVREAGEVERLIASISGTLASTPWTGPASDRFRSDWEGQYVPMLRSLTQSLNQSAEVVRNRRTAIEQATT